MYSSTNGLTKNINELQSDILAEKLSNNPYLKYHVLIEKNKQLNTTSQTIIGAINEVIRNTRLTAIDSSRNVSFKDQFVTGDEPQFTFRLSHLPKDDTLKVFINGIQYFNTNTTAYTFDSENREVVWVFDAERGGFDPVNSEIVFEYVYDMKQELEDLEEEGGN